MLSSLHSRRQDGQRLWPTRYWRRQRESNECEHVVRMTGAANSSVQMGQRRVESTAARDGWA